MYLFGMLLLNVVPIQNVAFFNDVILFGTVYHTSVNIVILFFIIDLSLSVLVVSLSISLSNHCHHQHNFKQQQ